MLRRKATQIELTLEDINEEYERKTNSDNSNGGGPSQKKQQSEVRHCKLCTIVVDIYIVNTLSFFFSFFYHYQY